MATTKNKSGEAYRSRYKTDKTWEKNRKRKLERTLKKQPNNKQVQDALKGGLVYRRKTPGEHGWTASQISVAKLWKEITGWFDRAILHPDPKVSQAAMSRPSTINHIKEPVSQFKSFFSLEARLQGTR